MPFLGNILPKVNSNKGILFLACHILALCSFGRFLTMIEYSLKTMTGGKREQKSWKVEQLRANLCSIGRFSVLSSALSY